MQNCITSWVSALATAQHNIKIVKSYQSPTAPDGGISWNAFAKQNGLTNAQDMLADKKTLESFYSSVQKNQQKWSEDIVKSFNENEKTVTDIISNIKNSLSETDIAASLQRILKAF